ncbi:Lipoate-protein ligase A [Mycoplasmopsis maculosa]|uniref:lipoate--protein ligase n=1 Tax=Mycoplasmopsis maculosa TaxID=114885 RepID=A0A449B4X9_9BACT|nr:lipoate--protein ligase [Mycoplasmopsis maculosa]VEU75626.1 Lipoate-protein ligase A [Mycoplasmopsis maculosa]
MKIFRIKETSPYVTLALENIIMNDPDITGDVLILYQHNNAIIIGNNQNAYEEINREFVADNKIELARRKSGGGAVYHDLGNINFSFISDKSDDNSYQKFLSPIIGFLNSLGLNAEFHGRNDILVNGYKISGNAQYISGNRIVSHGTILFDVDVTKLSNALKPNKIKFESKGIQSVRARVTNIINILPEKMSVEEFINKLIKYFIEKENSELLDIPFSKYDAKLNELKELFKSEKWIFDRAADFNFSNTEKFQGGLLTVKGQIEKGYIKKLYFEGDFLSKKDIREIEPLFENLHLDEFSITMKLDEIELSDYFGTLKRSEIVKLILG